MGEPEEREGFYELEDRAILLLGEVLESVDESTLLQSSPIIYLTKTIILREIWSNTWNNSAIDKAPNSFHGLATVASGESAMPWAE